MAVESNPVPRVSLERGTEGRDCVESSNTVSFAAVTGALRDIQV